MRKADYMLLANLIGGFLNDDSKAAQNDTARSAVILIAMTFAARANVDRIEFLKACGIKP